MAQPSACLLKRSTTKNTKVSPRTVYGEWPNRSKATTPPDLLGTGTPMATGYSVLGSFVPGMHNKHDDTTLALDLSTNSTAVATRESPFRRGAPPLCVSSPLGPSPNKPLKSPGVSVRAVSPFVGFLTSSFRESGTSTISPCARSLFTPSYSSTSSNA